MPMSWIILKTRISTIYNLQIDKVVIDGGINILIALHTIQGYTIIWLSQKKNIEKPVKAGVDQILINFIESLENFGLGTPRQDAKHVNKIKHEAQIFGVNIAFDSNHNWIFMWTSVYLHS